MIMSTKLINQLVYCRHIIIGCYGKVIWNGTVYKNQIKSLCLFEVHNHKSLQQHIATYGCTHQNDETYKKEHQKSGAYQASLSHKYIEGK